MGSGSFEPDLTRWDAWHPAEVAARLAGVGVPWYVAAGWALDLFRGEQTRPHDDLEIAVPSYGFADIEAALGELELLVVGDGYAHPVDERSLAAHHQTWARERDTGTWRLDVMREPWQGDTWICRRDPRLRRHRSEVIAHTDDGIPYAEPDIVLLFKAKAMREKDRADFEGVFRLLTHEHRGRLADALALVHPGHPWLDALSHR